MTLLFLIGLLLLIFGAIGAGYIGGKNDPKKGLLAVLLVFVLGSMLVGDASISMNKGEPTTDLSTGKEYIVLSIFSLDEDTYLTLRDIKGGDPFWYKTKTENVIGLGLQPWNKIFMIETEKGLELRTY
ncbi:MAG: hypothetical protein WC319_01020 [Candidatus Paceibacterota bacterium]|jgi:hypothetical protein